MEFFIPGCQDRVKEREREREGGRGGGCAAVLIVVGFLHRYRKHIDSPSPVQHYCYILEATNIEKPFSWFGTYLWQPNISQ